MSTLILESVKLTIPKRELRRTLLPHRRFSQLEYSHALSYALT